MVQRNTIIIMRRRIMMDPKQAPSPPLPPKITIPPHPMMITTTMKRKNIDVPIQNWRGYNYQVSNHHPPKILNEVFRQMLPWIVVEVKVVVVVLPRLRGRVVSITLLLESVVGATTTRVIIPHEGHHPRWITTRNQVVPPHKLWYSVIIRVNKNHDVKLTNVYPSRIKRTMMMMTMMGSVEEAPPTRIVVVVAVVNHPPTIMKISTSPLPHWQPPLHVRHVDPLPPQVVKKCGMYEGMKSIPSIIMSQ
jgi:hypothetical protein